jgi:hypothetical protein
MTKQFLFILAALVLGGQVASARGPFPKVAGCAATIRLNGQSIPGCNQKQLDQLELKAKNLLKHEVTDVDLDSVSYTCNSTAIEPQHFQFHFKTSDSTLNMTVFAYRDCSFFSAVFREQK